MKPEDSINPYVGHVHILFLCNGTQCGENHDCGYCKHTTNALYAKNFELSMINNDGQNTEYYFTEKEVELTEEQAIDKLRETGWLQEHDKILTEPKKGKWIEHKDRNYCKYGCNICGTLVNEKSPICPTCKTEMEVKKNEKID